MRARYLLALFATLALAWGMYTGAHASPAYVHGHTHTARIYCAGWAEDSAAHLRLVSFDHGRAVYTCKRHGY